jgi:hypothetical protein
MDGARYPMGFYMCCPHCLFIPPEISFCHYILCIWTQGAIIFLIPENKSKKLVCNFSEVLHCSVLPLVIKFLKSLMLQICIRVIYICNAYFLLYISLWEKQIRDCSLQTFRTTFVVHTVCFHCYFLCFIGIYFTEMSRLLRKSFKNIYMLYVVHLLWHVASQFASLPSSLAL